MEPVRDGRIHWPFLSYSFPIKRDTLILLRKNILLLHEVVAQVVMHRAFLRTGMRESCSGEERNRRRQKWKREREIQVLKRKLVQTHLRFLSFPLFSLKHLLFSFRSNRFFPRSISPSHLSQLFLSFHIPLPIWFLVIPKRFLFSFNSLPQY